MIKAADSLRKLEAQAFPDTSIRFQTIALKLELQSRRGAHSDAIEAINLASEEFDNRDADIAYHLRLLCLKAKMFRKANVAEQGFSISCRALLAAIDAQVLPVVWEAAGALAGAFIETEDYRAARDLVLAVIYQVSQIITCECTWLTSIEGARGG